MTAIGLITELLTIVGVGGAVVCTLVWLGMRLARGRWLEAPAEIVDNEVRWMSLGGDVQKARIADGDQPSHADETLVFYRERVPDRAHWHPIAHDERALGRLAIIFAGIALIATITSFVTLMIG